MSIHRGFNLTHAEAEKLTGQKITSRAFDWALQGGRILVVLDEIKREMGNLLVPDTVQLDAGTGWIIAVGPLAGITQANQTIGSISADNPKDLLGQHIMFGKSRGLVIQFSIYDSEYESSILMLAPLDILAVDESKDPLNADHVFEEAYRLSKQGQEDEAEDRMEQARRDLIEGREG